MLRWTPTFATIDHPSWPHPVQASLVPHTETQLRYGPGPLSFEGLAGPRRLRSLRAVARQAKAELDAAAAPGTRAAVDLMRALLAYQAGTVAQGLLRGSWRLDIRAMAAGMLGLRLWGVDGNTPLSDLPSPEGLWRLCLHAPDLAPGRRLSDPDRRVLLPETPCGTAHARLDRQRVLLEAIDALVPHLADGHAWRTHLLRRLTETGAPLP